MRALVIFCITIFVLGIVGYMGYRYLVGQQANTVQTTQPAVKKNINTTITGTLNKTTGESRYSITSSGKTTMVDTYSQNLEPFVGKVVEITGQFSGNTLFVDVVTAK